MITFLVAFLLTYLAWRARRWIVVFLLLALLTACGEEGTPPQVAASVELQALRLTEAETTCPDDPAKPRKPAKDASPAAWSAYHGAVARWLTELQANGQACRGALGLVHDRAFPPADAAAPAPANPEPTS